MADTVNGIVSLFLMMAVGFALAKAGWIKPEGDALLVKLALKIAVPCSLFTNAMAYLGDGLSVSDPLCFVLPVVTIAVTFGLAVALARVLKVPKNQRGLASSVFAMSNTIIIGLPVCSSIFGEAGIPYVILYYAANTILFWTVGAALIGADGGREFKLGWRSIGRVFSPALVAFLLGLVLVLLKIKLPTVVSKTVDSIGRMNTPLCMIIVGASIARMGFRAMFRLGRGGVLALAGRILISPMIVLAACLLTGFRGVAARVFVLMAAMPAMNQSVLVAKNCGADDELAAKLLSATALLMMADVPLLVLLVNEVL